MAWRRMVTWTAAIGALITLMVASSVAAQSGHMTGTPESHQHGSMMATPGTDGPMMGSTGNGVIYLTITNSSDEDDALVSATTDRAQQVELHEMSVEEQVATMHPADGPLPIPAGETVTLEPGGLHLMMVNLNESNRAGDVFELTLTFERAGDVSIEVPVRPDAEAQDGEPESHTVEAGDLIIEGTWSRPAPRLTPAGESEATPAS
jgi:copper(I)-binding protein